MKVTAVPAQSLSDDLVARWRQLQAADPNVDSPYFRPEFTQAVAEVRKDVEVAVLEDGSRTVGFFPFQRNACSMGRPVGGPLSDFQGIVLEAGYSINPVQLLRGCRLHAWHFDHLLAVQTHLADHALGIAKSPYIELSAGYDAYLKSRLAAQASEVSQAVTKARKAERQVGPVRLEFESLDQRVLDQLIDWKKSQYKRTGVVDVFSFPWTLSLIRRLLEMPQSKDFGGLLSALYFGDTLAAVHFGMRSDRVMHWWFCAYNSELGKYSPGNQLLLSLVREAATAGVQRIDLGKGNEPYKRSFMTGETMLADGLIATHAMRVSMSRLWRQTRQTVRDSPIGRPLSVVLRSLSKLRYGSHFRLL